MATFTFNSASNQTRNGTNQPDTFTFTGSGSQDLAVGNDGDDVFNLNNTPAGGASYTNVTIFGGLGADSITGIGSFSLVYGNQNDDTINLDGTGANSTIYGGQGNDSIGMDVEFPGGQAANGSNYLIYGNRGNDAIDIEFAGGSNTVYGGEGSDSIVGSTGADLLVGGQGNDLIYGLGEGSLIFGDSAGSPLALSGDDMIASIGGTSTVFGGQGADAIAFAGSQNRIYGNQGNDIIGDFGSSPSTPGTAGNNKVYGGQGNDVIATASALADSVGGGLAGAPSNDDVIYGNLGNDQLLTGFDRTTVYGGQGNDQIAGTNTQSVLVGGANNDIFYLGGATVPGNQAITVSDFVTGFDQISFGTTAAPAPTSTTNNFSSAQITGGLNEAKMAAATSGTVYTFVAGSSDGFLFFNDGSSTLQGADLTGLNNINAVKFTDITTGAAPTAPTTSSFPDITDI